MRDDPREVKPTDPDAGPERDELLGECVPVHAHERGRWAAVEDRRRVSAREELVQRPDQE